MDADRCLALSPLLDRALELSGAERATWLDALCLDDPASGDEIEAMLGEADDLERSAYLEQGAVAFVPDVDFESSLYTAQVFDNEAGNLTARHASGGPAQLGQSPFHFGINDVVSGDYATGATFSPNVFRLYSSWNEVGHHAPDAGESMDRSVARASVARGETLFDSKPIMITGVGGLNDALNAPTIPGTCSTCHDTPNAGSHSIPAPLDIGIADATRRTPDMPLYTLRHRTSPFEIVQTTDPGRALISGRWKDIGRFKGPTLRGLATRAPYFHTRTATEIAAVVDFYDQRFGIGLTAEEKQDLVAFLRTL